jgi:hypothetical protein
LFEAVDKPELRFTIDELVLILPLGEKENRWAWLRRLVRLRDELIEQAQRASNN